MNNDHPVIYLDHAATSWPKPPEVFKAMQEALIKAGANPGRGSHAMAVQASRVLFRTRQILSELFHIKNANDIVFTSNTTMALNFAIKGWIKPGDHVIATMIEHNSVRRPLEYLKRTKGVTVDYIPVNEEGSIDLKKVEQAFRPNTSLVVCNHSSNLLGSILPVGELGDMAHRHGAVFAVDAAQTAGTVNIDVNDMDIDLLAFPGHKGLLGPQGTGGLYIAPHIDLTPLLHGGTGSQSIDTDQPSVRPDRYEAGTPNTVGIAGLHAGVQTVLNYTTSRLYEQEWRLTQRLMDGLGHITDIKVFGPQMGEERTGIVSFIMEGKDSSEIAFRLDQEFGIAVRAGFHCTPLAHSVVDTLKTGAVRASVGYDTTNDDIDVLLEALRHISKI
nr:aminotransferase class V-fold PLP-dependent enzyme [Paenibacillus sediminis]